MRPEVYPACRRIQKRKGGNLRRVGLEASFDWLLSEAKPFRQSGVRAFGMKLLRAYVN